MNALLKPADFQTERMNGIIYGRQEKIKNKLVTFEFTSGCVHSCLGEWARSLE